MPLIPTVQEAFDYIGSSRMVFEMDKNRFPYDREGPGPSKVGLHNLNVRNVVYDIIVPKVYSHQTKTIFSIMFALYRYHSKNECCTYGFMKKIRVTLPKPLA